MNDEPGSRRRALLGAAGAAGLGLLSGCTGSTDGGSGTAPTTRTDATARTESDSIPYDVAVDRALDDWDGYDPDWTAPEGPARADYEVETLVENLEIPWDLSFADGELFVSERTGRVLAVDGAERRTVTEPADAIDAGALAPGSDEQSWLVEGGEGGLLGVAAHPTYPDPPLVYAYYTTDTEAGKRNRVVAVDADDPRRSWPVVEDIPADTYHNGGRIAFGPEGDLWVTTGDGDPGLEDPAEIRDPGTLGGAVLRVRPDGSAPVQRRAHGGDPRVFTYGHRNPQAVTWLPDGTPVIAEHGPGGGDEVNVLTPGGDYGWPEVRADDRFGSYADSDYRPPVLSARDWAPSGGVFYTGAVDGLSGRLLLGGLISQQAVAVTLGRDPPAEGHDTVHDEAWLDGDYRAASDTLLGEYGRIRHLEQGPDGGLYAVTSNRDGRAGEGYPTGRDDRLLRIRPA